MDLIPGSAAVPIDDVLCLGIKHIAKKIARSSGCEPLTDRLKHPQSRVGRVVLRSFTGVRKAVRDDALIQVIEKTFENLPGFIQPSGSDEQAREADHRVPS